MNDDQWAEQLREKAIARFWAKVDVSAGPDGCWLWLANVNRKGTHGYGRFGWVDGKGWLAHRLAYTLLIGDIPAGLTIDHLCKTALCCNPSHMEPVTQAENVRRGDSVFAQNARKTHCKNGHALEGENLGTQPGGRRCRACSVALSKASNERRKKARALLKEAS